LLLLKPDDFSRSTRFSHAFASWPKMSLKRELTVLTFKCLNVSFDHRQRLNKEDLEKTEWENKTNLIDLWLKKEPNILFRFFKSLFQFRKKLFKVWLKNFFKKKRLINKLDELDQKNWNGHLLIIVTYITLMLLKFSFLVIIRLFNHPTSIYFKSPSFLFNKDSAQL